MSMQRRCDYTKCVDGKWYLTLGDEEHAWDDWNCTVYGPFETEEEASEFCDLFSNPGGSSTFPDGTLPVPENVTHPDEERGTRVGAMPWL
ncbi:hypothetical protein [Burkholderia cenocepacia]|uniref:hypothetical protein n=1 Tax=Burkholderia cenocepacia TaxID=95486 RepID=UPI000761C118|nr:hypothetical protein [Burkholderia cenocepacia]KWU26431.1 hypothetical protein AS149_25935 [Burkholderia cenocepacia]